MRLVRTLTDIFGRVFKLGQPYLRGPSEAAQVEINKESQRWKETVKMLPQEDGTTLLVTPLQPGAAADIVSAKNYLEGQEQKVKYIRGLRWVMDKYK